MVVDCERETSIYMPPSPPGKEVLTKAQAVASMPKQSALDL